MVWCVTTEKYLEFKKESVCAFLTRNNLSISTHAVIKISFKDGAYASEEILNLNSRLEANDKRSQIYILTKPECTFTVYLNEYARNMLRTSQNKLTIHSPNALSVLAALNIIKQYFPSFHHMPYFSLYYCSRKSPGMHLKQAKLNKPVEFLPSAVYLQPTNPFEFSRTLVPSFTGEFYQLKTLNSSTFFSKKYIVSIYSHFLFAIKKGSTSPLGQSLEITLDLISYKQIIGDRTLAIIEQGGTRWSLFSKNIDDIDRLLHFIGNTPKHHPRDIYPDVAKNWENRCINVQEIISHNITSSSLPRADVLFPQEIPMVKEGLQGKEKDVAALIRKLESHIQRSIWDNVNIEFIVYLLQLKGFSLTDDIHQEIRNFSTHRKNILNKLKEVERSL